ncbi:MAG: ATP-binding protein [Flavitalea sp.]
MENQTRTYDQLLIELSETKAKLEEANDTIEAIRTGQIDGLVVENGDGHQLYTLQSADITYRVFIEQMSEGAVTLNKEGIILYCNQQFSNIVGSAVSDIIGFPFQKYVTQSSRSQFLEIFTTCWETNCKTEVVIIGGEKEIPVLLSLTAIQLADGLSLSMIVTDLTILKRNEQKLQENYRELESTNHALEVSNNDLQQFASVASHDLQEPLRKIQLFSERLQSRAVSELSPESSKYLTKIAGSARRMRDLVLDILNYSKLSNNANSFQQTDVNLLLKELIDDFEVSIREKEVEVNIEPIPNIELNGGQIRQVFQNIISNALKFTRPGITPQIQITSKRLAEKSFDAETDPNGPFCMISIADNGIGFDDKFSQSVFVLFERLNSKDSFEGTGIGLTITKKIIEKHSGLITAEGRPDFGSTFRFILPLKQ